jgi:hypothetical protein
VATDAELFDGSANATRRNPDNFYATWQDGPFLTGASYTLRHDAWGRLRSGNRLFYRLITSASRTSWERPTWTTTDENFGYAPSIVISAAPRTPRLATSGPGSEPSTALPVIVGPETQYGRSSEPPSFLVSPGRNRFYGVELAGDPLLFGDATEEGRPAPAEFFASWEDGLRSVPEGEERVVFPVPPEAWKRLHDNQQVFYRLVTSASADAWRDVEWSYPTDSDAAPPSVAIVDRSSAPRLVPRPHRPEEALWRE